MSTPKVSVVLSAFNSERFISSTIESILGQTFTDFEFIIVEDGSKDKTWEIITGYAAVDPRIIALRNEKNLGVVAGLNRGLAKSSGQYIARQDGDDISVPERLQKQVCFLDEHPDYGLVGSRVVYIDIDGTPLETENPFTPTTNVEIQEKLLDNNYLCGPAVMIRRQSLEKAGFWFREGLDASEDYDIHLRLAEVSKLAALEDALYLYRQHPESATSTQEFRQVVHKAVALEQAIRRRKGDQATPNDFIVVASDYIWAAILAHSRGDLEGARASFEKSKTFVPDILEQSELLEKYIRFRLPDEFNHAVPYINKLFEGYLPGNKVMNRLKNQLISSVHMRELFSGKDISRRTKVYHLWRGIYHDPKWINNRGVLSIAIRLLAGL